jgi:hypothetical protein
MKKNDAIIAVLLLLLIVMTGCVKTTIPDKTTKNSYERLPDMVYGEGGPLKGNAA